MLIRMSEFLKLLPAKKCCECGKKINEQHECYGNTCSNCLHKKY